MLLSVIYLYMADFHNWPFLVSRHLILKRLCYFYWGSEEHVTSLAYGIGSPEPEALELNGVQHAFIEGMHFTDVCTRTYLVQGYSLSLWKKTFMDTAVQLLTSFNFFFFSLNMCLFFEDFSVQNAILEKIGQTSKNIHIW